MNTQETPLTTFTKNYYKMICAGISMQCRNNTNIGRCQIINGEKNIPTEERKTTPKTIKSSPGKRQVRQTLINASS